MEYGLAYFLIISAVSVFACMLDKHNAKYGKWRISEKTLFGLSAIGGAFGMYLTMITIRHKTRHKSFMIGLPFMFLVHAVTLLLFLQRNA